MYPPRSADLRSELATVIVSRRARKVKRRLTKRLLLVNRADLLDLPASASARGSHATASFGRGSRRDRHRDRLGNAAGGRGAADGCCDGRLGPGRGNRRCPGSALRTDGAGQPGFGNGRVPRARRRTMVAGRDQRSRRPWGVAAHRSASSGRVPRRRRYNRPRRGHRDCIAKLDRRVAEIAVRRGRIDLDLRRVAAGENVQIDIPQGGVWLLQSGRYDIEAGWRRPARAHRCFYRRCPVRRQRRRFPDRGRGSDRAWWRRNRCPDDRASLRR